MMRIHAVLLVMCAFAGCKSADGKPAQAPEPAEPTIASVRAEACGCADEACADRMMVELERQRQEFEAAFAEATSCVQKIKPPKDPGDEVLQKMVEFRDKLCGCADEACVQGVDRQMMEWAMANLDQLKDIKPTKEQEDRADALDDEIDRCRERLSPATP